MEIPLEILEHLNHTENINNNYSASQVYKEILKYNLYAIATPKGIELFEKLIKNVNI